MRYVHGALNRSTLRVVNSTIRLRVLLLLLAIATTFLVVVTFVDEPAPVPPEEMEFGVFATAVETGSVASVAFTQGSASITGELRSGDTFRSVIPPGYSDELVTTLLEARPEIDIVTIQPEAGTNWFGIFGTLAPLLLMIVLVWAILSRMNGGKAARKKFTAKTRKKSSEIQDVTFADVAGAHEAVVELSEIKEFLSDPQRFQNMGAQIPKGVLLYGPPGTGKTLLARAVAGEAGVPFFTLSGSDFVEMYAGVGASRVRDLFDEARKQAPAIIFVDEIDAVGRHRGGGGGAGNEEREQTLNQLLVEMDGFDVDTGVIFIAATNRPDVLDPALLRPGRFDRQVGVERPDLAGRREIIAVHAKGKPLGPDADPETIARRTPGFTGADLANLLNESALLAARRHKTTIGQAEVDDALDRVIAGPEKGSTTLSDKEKYVIAYHEAGHALVGHVLPNTDPIHKVSIIARGKALGWTLALPDKDKVLKSRSELTDEMAMLLGGRIAEELIFGDPTTGAANDIERVTVIARSMVTDYGMSPNLGLQKFGLGVGESYASSTKQNYSDVIASKIDDEVRALVDEAADEARELLTLHRPVLDRLAEALIDQETLNKAELGEIFETLETVTSSQSPAAIDRDIDRDIDLRDEFSSS
jgi:cell division protease FtsH